MCSVSPALGLRSNSLACLTWDEVSLASQRLGILVILIDHLRQASFTKPPLTMKLIAFCLTCLVGACAITIPEGTVIGIQTDHGTISVTK